MDDDDGADIGVTAVVECAPGDGGGGLNVTERGECERKIFQFGFHGWNPFRLVEMVAVAG